MIFKERSSLDLRVRELEKALAGAHGFERTRIKRELDCACAGLAGEKEAAYHIDFHLKNSKNWAVIHDLRVEWKGRVAQIDHLLIDRLLEIYVVESKSFQTKLRFANGGWERFASQWEGIPSPVDQNDRHIIVLKELVKDRALAPTRFGLAPSFFNVVVVQPSCSIVGPVPTDAHVYRMDTLVKKIKAQNPSPLDLINTVSQETLAIFARALVSCHAPPQEQPRSVPVVRTPLRQFTGSCNNCGRQITRDEAEYCNLRKSQFASQLLCKRCQRYCPPQPEPSGRQVMMKRSDVATFAKHSAECARCGITVHPTVVAFCGSNSKRFDGLVVCRSCQGSFVCKRAKTGI